jgi:diacylglycerol kinase
VVPYIGSIINTALECLTDLVSPNFHELAKMTKDVSAGAVFVSALMSLAIGIIIFLPKLI